MTRIPITSRLHQASLLVIAIGAASTLVACGGPVPYGVSLTKTSGPNGSAGAINLSTNGSGTAGAGGGNGCNNAVQAVIRDFRGWASSASDPGGAAPKHPDFEPAVKTAEKGIAASTLGSDQKPAFGNNPVQTVTSADTFSQWYRDVDCVNMRFPIPLQLTPDPNDPTSLTYNNQTYFPIDNQGWGNQGQTHNYSFTTEIHTTFTYKGGETFTFIGDDDVFVYVNNPGHRPGRHSQRGDRNRQLRPAGCHPWHYQGTDLQHGYLPCGTTHHRVALPHGDKVRVPYLVHNSVLDVGPVYLD